MGVYQCDYAVGLSRMMNGRVVASERPGHTILEGLKAPAVQLHTPSLTRQRSSEPTRCGRSAFSI